MADGTDESRERLVFAINKLWSYTGEMFESSSIIDELVQSGIAVNLSKVQEKWNSEIKATFGELKLDIPTETWMHSGGRRGRHSEDLGNLLASMQYLQRAYPNSAW